MTNKPGRCRPTTYPPNPPAELDNDNYSTQNNYKNLSMFTKQTKEHISHKCPFRCCTCEVIGKELITLQYTDCNDVLIEDDNKLIFNPLENGGVN